MELFTISPPKNALLLFVDIIDSSIHSSILGIEEFAKKVLGFQLLFQKLGKQYFYNKLYFREKIEAFCDIVPRGDEGLVFVMDPRQNGSDLVLHAVKFILELKARLKILNLQQKDKPPREMKIAAGIHYGKVALITDTIEKNGKYRKPIARIMGYSINYAKRVESISRIGRYSQVFLSKEAADLLSYTPIVLCKYEASLKGIESKDEVYEVRSAFLDNIPASFADGAGHIKNEQFIDHFTKIKESEFLREPWLKSFVLSVLTSQQEKVKGTSLKKMYFEKISKIAWHKPIEDDPIMLFWRARECEKQRKYSRAVSCLKEILAKYPNFFQARIKLINSCFEMAKSDDRTSSELIFIRDTAEEMLEKYETSLSGSEKSQLKKILKQIKS